MSAVSMALPSEEPAMRDEAAIFFRTESRPQAAARSSVDRKSIALQSTQGGRPQGLAIWLVLVHCFGLLRIWQP